MTARKRMITFEGIDPNVAQLERLLIRRHRAIERLADLTQKERSWSTRLKRAQNKIRKIKRNARATMKRRILIDQEIHKLDSRKEN